MSQGSKRNGSEKTLEKEKRREKAVRKEIDEYKRRLVSFNKAAFIACHSRMKNERDLGALSVRK